jgi:hypothetical protein
MQKLGSGVVTTTQDVDCVEFDWGKIHFLSEPAVTQANRFSFGVADLRFLVSQGIGKTRQLPCASSTTPENNTYETGSMAPRTVAAPD